MPFLFYSYHVTDIGNNFGYIDEHGNWTGAIRLIIDRASATKKQIFDTH